MDGETNRLFFPHDIAASKITAAMIEARNARLRNPLFITFCLVCLVLVLLGEEAATKPG
ncbi:MAG: hypothetical protein HRF49_00895 [bacterium]